MTPALRARARGFTLLEMLVVMVLLGMLTTLALPAMQRWHDAIQLRARAAVVVDALRSASFVAGANRREMIVNAAAFVTPAEARAAEAAAMAAASAAAAAARAAPPAPSFANAGAAAGASSAGFPGPRPSSGLPVELPAGWTAAEIVEARFLANGLCRPGSVMLKTERGERVDIRIRGPVCVVEQAAPGEGNG